jgi:hypothetical protein
MPRYLFLAIVAFAAIAGLPWLIWEGFRGRFESVWWLMGLSLIVWAPLSFFSGIGVALKIIKVGSRKGTHEIRAKSDNGATPQARLIVCPCCHLETEALEQCVWCAALLSGGGVNAKQLR